MSADQSQDRHARLEYIVEQLGNYGCIASDELTDVLYDIVEINDDMSNLRDSDLIRAMIEKVKAGLDVALAAYIEFEAE